MVAKLTNWVQYNISVKYSSLICGCKIKRRLHKKGLCPDHCKGTVALSPRSQVAFSIFFLYLNGKGQYLGFSQGKSPHRPKKEFKRAKV